MRLHGRDSYVVTLIQETADLLGLWEVAGLVGAGRASRADVQACVGASRASVHPQAENGRPHESYC